MEQYIPKSAVVAEIKNLLDKGRYHEEYDCAYRDGNNGALYALKGKLDTIEVKEVDLDEISEKYIKEKFGESIEGFMIKPIGFYDLMLFAEHFFELGIKVQKGEEI